MNHIFTKNLIVHTHIPKAGGTTLVDAMKAIYGASFVYDQRMEDRFQKIEEPRKYYYKVVSGHFKSNSNISSRI